MHKSPNYKRISVFLACVFAGITLLISDAYAVSLTEFTVTDQIDRFWMRPIGAKTVFPPRTETVWATALLSDAPAETAVSLRLYHRDEKSQSIRVVHQDTIVADGSRYVAFEIHGGLSTGDYQAQFFLNGSEVGYVNFKVKPAGGTPSAATAPSGNPSQHSETLNIAKSVIAGLDAYEVLHPTETPKFYTGETVAMLLLGVGPFRRGPDGRHWFDMDVRVVGPSGKVVFSAQGYLGENGHIPLENDTADSPYAFFGGTDRMPPGQYAFQIAIYDRIGSGRAEVSRTFELISSESDPNMLPASAPGYRRYLDPQRRFGLLAPDGWTLIKPDDPSTAFFLGMNANLNPMAAIKVNVHPVELGAGQTASEVVEKVRQNILAEARAAGARIATDKGLKNIRPESVTTFVDMHTLEYVYPVGDGRRFYEVKAIVCGPGALKILTLTIDETVLAQAQKDPKQDWAEDIPLSFLQLTLDHSILR